MNAIRQVLFVPPAPVVWAHARDSFAAHDVLLSTTLTTSSDEIGAGLASGAWDIGIAVVDNVIAWNAERNAGLVILAQLEKSTVMAFLGLARFATLADAAREPIAVDATSNGFVLVLYRALAQAGIDWRTCRYDTVGGVRHRHDALCSGQAASTILIPPFIDMARNDGFKVLWEGRDIAPAYPGVVVTARSAWLREHEASARAYLRALRDANEWARANPAEAAAALIAARYSAPAAERLVRDIVPGLAVSEAGWDEVVALRSECGLMPAEPPLAARTIVSRYLDEDA